MRMKYFMAIAVSAASFNAVSQTNVCKQLNAAIDNSIVSAAVSYAEGDMNDKSAAQQTSRYININNYLQVINTNISLLTQNKCSPRQTPIFAPRAYHLSALTCYTDQLGKKEAAIQSCDYQSWKTNLDFVK